MLAGLGGMGGAEADEMAMLQQMMQQMAVPSSTDVGGRNSVAARTSRVQSAAGQPTQRQQEPPREICVVGFQAPVRHSPTVRSDVPPCCWCHFMAPADSHGFRDKLASTELPMPGSMCWGSQR